MDSWDSKMVLDKYVYDYMKKRNLHTTAETFRAEADISPNAVSIDSDEGFLREWWHIFWNTYISRTTETHVHKEVPPRVIPSVMVPGPGIGSFLGRSDSPRMMPTPGFKFPTSSFNAPSGMHGKGALTLPNRDFYSSSPFLNANDLDRHMLPSSSNSYPSERVYKNPQLCLTKDDKCGSGIWRSTIAGPARYPPRPTGLIIKSPDASDSRRFEQEQLRHPIRNSNVSSQLTDVERRTQDKAHSKMPLLSKDDKCGVGYVPRAGPIKIASSDTVPQSPVPGPATLIPVADQFRFPAKNSNFNPESDRVSSPTDCSIAQKNKKRHICVTRDNRCDAVETKAESHDKISDASITEQGHSGVPQKDLYPYSQIFNVGQLSRLLSASTKFNYPHQNPRKKKGQCCANSDERIVDTNSMRSVAAESTHQAPEAIPQPKRKTVESGSSASSNSRSFGSGPSS